MTKDEALTLALEALLEMSPSGPTGSEIWHKQMNAIRVASEALAQPERTGWPAGLLQDDDRKLSKWLAPRPDAKHVVDTERNFCPRCGKRTADLGTIHTCTPPIAAGPKAFYGFPSGSVSTPNAGGKCVTAGETAPIKEIDPNQWAFDRGLEST